MGERKYLVTQEELTRAIEEAETIGIPFSQKGAANGVATLNGSKELTASQVPVLVVSSSQGNFIPLKQFDSKWEVGHDSSKALKEAITASIAAGGVPILLPAGEGEINEEPLLPLNLGFVVPIWGCGSRSTIVKVTSAAAWLGFSKTSPGETIGNVELRGIGINANNYAETSSFGTSCLLNQAEARERVNIKNITIRDCRVFNLPALTAETGGRNGLRLFCLQPHQGEALNVIEDIDVDGLEVVGGQNGVYLGGQGEHSNFLNIRMKNVRVKNLIHLRPEYATKRGFATNIQIGGGAWSDGTGMFFEKIFGENSCDPGCEFDVPCTFRDIKIVNAYNNAVLLTTVNPTWTREPITAELTAEATVGATVLKVSSTTGFVAGEQVGSASQEVRTIKEVRTGEIELTEPLSFAWPNETSLAQLDDIHAVRFVGDNIWGERNHVKEGGGGTLLCIQNFENPLPLPGVEIDGLKWTCEVADLSNGDLVTCQPGNPSDSSPQGNPAFVKLTGIEVDRQNLTYAGTGTVTYQPVQLVMLAPVCPITLEGEIRLSGPACTSTGKLEGAVVRTERTQMIYDFDLVTKVALGKTGGKPFIHFNLQSYASKGDISGRIRHRARPSVIETAEAGSVFVGVQFGNARGFASKSLTSTLSATAAVSATVIEVASAVNFSVGEWIVVGTGENADDVNRITEISGTKLSLLLPTHYEHLAGAQVSVLRTATVEDTDWSGLPSSAEPFNFPSESPTGGLAAALRTRNIVYPSPPASKALSVAATGKANAVLTTTPGVVSITGGVVAAVEWSPDGKDWLPISEATGAFFDVQPGDAWRVTYSSAPMATFYPTVT